MYRKRHAHAQHVFGISLCVALSSFPFKFAEQEVYSHLSTTSCGVLLNTDAEAYCCLLFLVQL